MLRTDAKKPAAVVQLLSMSGIVLAAVLVALMSPVLGLGLAVLLLAASAGLALLGRQLAGLLLAVLIGIALLNRFEFSVLGFTARPEHVLGPGLIGGLLVLGVATRRQFITADRFMLLAFAWWLVNLIASLLFAPEPAASMVHIVRFAILIGIYCLVYLHVRADPVNWRAVIRAWMVLGIAQMIYGIVAWLALLWFDLDFGAEIPRGSAYAAPYGTLFERNIFGSFAASLLVLWTVLLLVDPRGQGGASPPFLSRRWLFVALVLSGIGLLISLTRGAWVAAVVGTAVILLLTARRRALPFQGAAVFLVLLPLAAVVLVTFGLLFPETGLGSRVATFTELSSDRTTVNRLAAVQIALQDWSESPWLGRGTGSFQQIHGILFGSTAWVPNLIAHTLQNTGVIGLIVQMSLFLGILGRGLRLRRHLDDDPDGSAAVGFGLAIGLLVLLIAFMTTDATWNALFWIHLALLNGTVELTRRRLAKETIRPQAARNDP